MIFLQFVKTDLVSIILLLGLLCGAKNPLQERLAEQMLRTMDHHQSALLSPAHQVIA